MKYVLAAAACAAATLPTCADATTVTVSTTAALNAALKTAAGGDIIRVAPGIYGSLDIKNLNPASAVTIMASNSAQLPVFTHLSVTTSSNIRINRLVVASPAPDVGNPALTAAVITKSSDIRLSGMTFRGVLGGGVANDARGLRISGSSAITVAGNSFTELSHGITTDGSTGMVITDNGFTGIRTDGITSDGASSSNISRNRFADFRPEAGDHADAIQLFNTGNATFNLTVNDNLVVGSALGQTQGIFMTNASAIRSQLDKINITNNTLWGTLYNGIAVSDANRVFVTGNALYSNTLLPVAKTWVRLTDLTNATVSANYAGAYLYDDVGTVLGSGNILNLSDIAALAAVATWDATHSASGYSIAYNDDSLDGGLTFDPDDQLVAARSGLAGREIGAIAGVPEPASWVSTIAGFLGIGIASRRLQRRRVSAIRRA